LTEFHKAKIMIVNNDPDILELTEIYLKAKGYEILCASNGKEALKKIKDNSPCLILLDLDLPDIRGTEVIETLKSDPVLWHIPIIFFTIKNNMEDKTIGMQLGADDYVVKPFEPEELISRIKMILVRTSHILNASPLTKLPWNTLINAKIVQLIEQSEKYAICYLDIDNFKSFNDEYGFSHGDLVLENTATLLTNVLKKQISTCNFIGHIGGDDFVFITKPEYIDTVCQKTIKHFDEMVLKYYSEKDKKNGFLTVTERNGKTRKFPLMSASIAVITNEQRNIQHIAEINAIAAELKKHAKSYSGSIYIKDRRSKVL
jgi:diguanylate cyclase (GGDEF)-like protein